ncbi:MAG TPA: hypothetical protein VNF73_07365, partial [Candidatus Saccharimonadales bacterium]|nr:hypothetical protein [Candidatus Saccharimonadales bacterium]
MTAWMQDGTGSSNPSDPAGPEPVPALEATRETVRTPTPAPAAQPSVTADDDSAALSAGPTVAPPASVWSSLPTAAASPAASPAAWPPTWAPDPARWTPTGDETQTYSPLPQTRPGWARPAWEPPVRPTPEAWFEPAPLAVPAPPVRRDSQRGGAVALVLAASIVSATLAAGGTYFALSSSGALDRGVTFDAPSPVVDQSGGLGSPALPPVDTNSAIINVAAKVSPAV